MGAVIHQQSELEFGKGDERVIEVIVSYEEETTFLAGRFGNIEDVRLHGEIAGDGDTKHIHRGRGEVLLLIL